MGDMKLSVIGLLSGDQLVDIFKTLAAGAVILILAYGAYNSGYSIQLCKGDVKIALNPENTKNKC